MSKHAPDLTSLDIPRARKGDAAPVAAEPEEPPTSPPAATDDSMDQVHLALGAMESAAVATSNQTLYAKASWAANYALPLCSVELSGVGSWTSCAAWA